MIAALVVTLAAASATSCGGTGNPSSGCGPIGDPMAMCVDPALVDAGVDGGGCPSGDQVSNAFAARLDVLNVTVESGPTDQFGECCYVVQEEALCF